MASSPSSSSHPSARPLVRPLFLGKPLHPPHSGPRPAASASNPAASVYIRSANAAAAFAASPQTTPFALSRSPSDAAANPIRATHPFAVHCQQPPPPPYGTSSAATASGPPRAAPALPSSPKVAPFPAVSLAPENSNFNDRERSRDDIVVMIHGRKVRMSEGRSGSLYALCRSWVRNGSPQESQPNISDSLRLLPKPLPASAVNSQLLKQSEETNEADDSGKEEDTISSEQLSADDLLKGHIKRAKKVRARFRKERLLRIERYKQRLSLLLPTHIELLGRNDATPKR